MKQITDDPNLYDLLYDNLSDDIEVYSEIVSDKNVVIEYGAGTGRITIPLARKGIKVIALDNSEAMLKKLEEKITEELKDNIDIVKNSFLNEELMKRELQNNPFAKVLVYVKDDILQGYLYYSNIYDRLEINQIEVELNFRRQGIASKLIEELLKENKDITLEVRENNKQAIELYEKYGFKKVDGVFYNKFITKCNNEEYGYELILKKDTV